MAASHFRISRSLECATSLQQRETCEGNAEDLASTVLPYQAMSAISSDVDDIVVALEQRDRVCEIILDRYPSFHSLGTVVSAMLIPFPAFKLKRLCNSSACMAFHFQHCRIYFCP
jgi:hypothetical protein